MTKFGYILAGLSLCLAPMESYAQAQTEVPMPLMAAPLQAQTALLAPAATKAYYIERYSAGVWGDETNFDKLLMALRGLELHGLNPDHYHLEELERLKSEPAQRDRIATDAWFSAAAHMLYGKLDPKSVEPNWTAAGRKADLAAMLTAALDSGNVAGSLEALAPKQAGYKTLVTEYARLKTLAAIPVQKVPSGDALKPKMSGARVTALQARLAQLELLDQSQVTGTMDEPTDIALKTFQTQQDLDSDGVAGAASIAALNRGAEEELAQVRVNLERWRWLPDDLGRRHVRANIAGFTVTTWENAAPVRTHLTIVGKAYRKTPVFSDEIEYAVLNPWWETPISLSRADKLPQFKRDPGAVERLGFQVLDSNGRTMTNVDWSEVSASTMPRIRQKPGPLNALGQVKIIFPNQHNVYFHDTPTRDLFASRQRAFSSGCLRTQDPIDLTKWLLAETPQWTPEKIDEAVASGKETRADLASNVPVHILYFTVVSEQDGHVRYLDDIYQRDGAVLVGLRATPRSS